MKLGDKRPFSVVNCTPYSPTESGESQQIFAMPQSETTAPQVDAPGNGLQTPISLVAYQSGRAVHFLQPSKVVQTRGRGKMLLEVSPRKMAKLVHVCAEAEEQSFSDSDLMNMPVYDAVVLDPERGWKIWESTYKRDYDESSEARSLSPPFVESEPYIINST